LINLANFKMVYIMHKVAVLKKGTGCMPWKSLVEACCDIPFRERSHKKFLFMSTTAISKPVFVHVFSRLNKSIQVHDNYQGLSKLQSIAYRIENFHCEIESKCHRSTYINYNNDILLTLHTMGHKVFFWPITVFHFI